jgi:disulfide bond formation protein DsbB
LPCPLCLLQRAGFIAIGMGFLFNMRLGERASHYAMILIASLVTGFISIRQVSLHLAPGDPGYGSTLFGLHFYTWALIAAVGIVCYVALVFVLKDVTGERDRSAPLNGRASSVVLAIFALLVAANLLSTVLE